MPSHNEINELNELLKRERELDNRIYSLKDARKRGGIPEDTVTSISGQLIKLAEDFKLKKNGIPETLMKWGTLLLENDRPKEGTEFIGKGLENSHYDKKPEIIFFTAIKAYKKIGRNDLSLLLLKEANKRFPHDIKFKTALASEYTKKEEHQEVINLLSPIYDTGKSDPISENLLAIAYRATGNFKKEWQIIQHPCTGKGSEERQRLNKSFSIEKPNLKTHFYGGYNDTPTALEQEELKASLKRRDEETKAWDIEDPSAPYTTLELQGD